MKKWLEKRQGQVLPKGLLGKAINYCLGQWHRLTNYLKSGYASIDNNSAENAIRPFVIGRKNWLFSGTPAGARAGATIYSLIESAKACGLEPYACLPALLIWKSTDNKDSWQKTLITLCADRPGYHSDGEGEWGLIAAYVKAYAKIGVKWRVRNFPEKI